MGRKRAAHSAAVRQKFQQRLSGGRQAVVSLKNSTRHDKRKAIFRTTCSNELHMACLAVDSMNDLRKSSNRCRVCSRKLPRQPSTHEKRAYKMLDGMEVANATEVFIFDTSMDAGGFGFKVSRHPFDILLVDYLLLIEIDGSQHFSDKHHGKCTAEQQYRDAIIDAAVLDEGWSLVRLHYLDAEKEWQETIEAAVLHQMSSKGGSVHYSPYYNAKALL
jgi:hypothetical protein